MKEFEKQMVEEDTIIFNQGLARNHPDVLLYRESTLECSKAEAIDLITLAAARQHNHLVIHYTGHGFADDGNWSLKGKEVFKL